MWKIAVVCLLATIASGKKASVKIVYEPSLFGLDQSGDSLISPSDDGNKLTLGMQPANFSGPIQFKRLIGKCFVYNSDKYKYNLCPFNNITQHDKTNSFNPFEGVLGRDLGDCPSWDSPDTGFASNAVCYNNPHIYVLGVWQGWEIENNKFSSMLMGHGDRCGEMKRESRITFTCGKTSMIVNITEPSHCSYVVNFTTPLVCDPTSMMVYPRLTADQKQRWDQIETDLTVGDITEKGYRKMLKKLFEDAGLQLSEKKVEELENLAYKQKAGRSPQFTSIYQCQDSYSDLKAELERTKAELRSCMHGGGFDKDYTTDTDDFI